MDSYKDKEIKKILRFSKLKHKETYTAHEIEKELKLCENIKDSTIKDKEIEWQEISEFWQNQMIELLRQAEIDKAKLVRHYREIVIKKRDDEIQELKETIKRMIKTEKEQKSKIIGLSRKVIKLNREIENLKGAENA